MKRKIGSLLLYTFLFYQVFGPLREYLEGDDPYEIWNWFDTTQAFLLVSTSILAFMAYSLGAYLVLYYCYKKVHTWLLAILIVLVVPVSIAFRYLLQEVLMYWLTGEGNYTEGYPLDMYFIDNLYYAFVFVSFGVIIYFLHYSQYKEKQEQQLQIENQQIQLSLLRSQINPHFLFNALNNIYALVNENNKQSLPALEKLSSILRYSLYEQSEFVPFDKEWQKIEDYITLESMRLPYRPALLLDVPPTLPAVCIPPFLFIGLVENAFKHGQLDQPESPTRIKISQEKEVLRFQISNAIAQKNKDEVGGIGLQNIRDRLALIYPDTHTFEVENIEQQFSVLIEIPAKPC